MKKIVAVVLSTMLVMSLLVGCGTETVTNTESRALPKNTSLDETAKKELTEAVATLRSKDNYLIANQLSAPDGSASYIEAVNKGETYTEYPVQDNTDSSAENQATQTQYELQDWVTLDGKGYTYVGGQWYQFPDAYAQYLDSRKVMYADKIIPALTALYKEPNTEKADIGDGEEEFTMYVGELPASVASEILSINTKKVYETIVDNYKDDEKYKNEVHLAQLYLQDLEKTMTVSDADVEFAVKDGILREVNITVGGLGTKLKYFRAVAFNAQHKAQEKPQELSADNIASIVETMKEMAEFAKDFNSYDEMLRAYQEKAQQADDMQDVVSGGAVEVDSAGTEMPASTTIDKSKKNKKNKTKTE